MFSGIPHPSTWGPDHYSGTGSLLYPNIFDAAGWVIRSIANPLPIFPSQVVIFQLVFLGFAALIPIWLPFLQVWKRGFQTCPFWDPRFLMISHYQPRDVYDFLLFIFFSYNPALVHTRPELNFQWNCLVVLQRFLATLRIKKFRKNTLTQVFFFLFKASKISPP